MDHEIRAEIDHEIRVRTGGPEGRWHCPEGAGGLNTITVFKDTIMIKKSGLELEGHRAAEGFEHEVRARARGP